MALSNFFWDSSKPLNETLIPDGPQAWRYLVGNIPALFGSEHHTFPTATNIGAWHLPGSANIFVAATAPLTRVDSTAFSSEDVGRLWYDTTDGIFKILTAVDTDIWTSLPSLTAANNFTGGFTVTTDKFTIDEATGNTAIAGTLDVTGATELIGIATIADASVTKTTTAPTGDAMIANKLYVDESTDNPGLAKAFCSFNASGTLGSGSFNVTSVVRNGLGEYTITWDTDFANTNYVVSVTPNTVSKVARPNTKATGTCTISTQNLAGSSDDTACEIVAFGTLS